MLYSISEPVKCFFCIYRTDILEKWLHYWELLFSDPLFRNVLKISNLHYYPYSFFFLTTLLYFYWPFIAPILIAFLIFSMLLFLISICWLACCLRVTSPIEWDTISCRTLLWEVSLFSAFSLYFSNSAFSLVCDWFCF